MNNPELSKLQSLCARSEQAPYDIFQKALKMGLDSDTAQSLVDQLVSDNFLNTERYAQAFVNDKFRFEHWGRIKISYALRTKQIPDHDISIALEEKIDDDEYLETCCDLLRSRMRGMSLPLSPNDRARLYRYLAQRGFESEVIGRALSTLISQL